MLITKTSRWQGKKAQSIAIKNPALGLGKPNEAKRFFDMLLGS